LNELFDVKHIRDDLNAAGLTDPRVHALVAKLQRLVVTYNSRDFRALALQSQERGVIGVSPHLPLHQVDPELAALLMRSSEKALQGKFTSLTGEV
jgi:hypothetical protein